MRESKENPSRKTASDRCAVFKVTPVIRFAQGFPLAGFWFSSGLAKLSPFRRHLM